MMRYTILPLLALTGLLLVGCGQDEDDAREPAAPAAPTAPEPRTTAEPRAAAVDPAVDAEPGRPMIEQYEIVLIDHSRDVKEFRLRRSLAGVEAMLEEGLGDRSQLRKQKSELEKKIKDLLK